MGHVDWDGNDGWTRLSPLSNSDDFRRVAARLDGGAIAVVYRDSTTGTLSPNQVLAVALDENGSF